MISEMRHQPRKLLYRARDPEFVADSAIRAMTYLWDFVSPFEFSVLFRQVQPYTMCSNARLRGLYRAVRYVAEKRVGGDLVECGSARGGSAALMALTSRHLGERRKIWLFDTFEGLPAPTSDEPDSGVAGTWGNAQRFGCSTPSKPSPHPPLTILIMKLRASSPEIVWALLTRFEYYSNVCMSQQTHDSSKDYFKRRSTKVIFLRSQSCTLMETGTRA